MQTIEATPAEISTWIEDHLIPRLQMRGETAKAKGMIAMIPCLQKSLFFSKEEFVAATYFICVLPEGNFRAQVYAAGNRCWEDSPKLREVAHFDSDRDAFITATGTKQVCADIITLSPFHPEAQKRISDAVAACLGECEQPQNSSELFAALYTAVQWIEHAALKIAAEKLASQQAAIAEKVQRALNRYSVSLSTPGSKHHASQADLDMMDRHPGARRAILELE